MFIRSTLGTLPYAAMTVLLSNCSLMEISKESGQINTAAEITGVIQADTGSSAPIKVLLFRKEEKSPILDTEYALQGEGSYRFSVHPDTYYLVTYQDLDQDGLYQRSEPALIYGGSHAENARPITVGKNEHAEIPTLTITAPLQVKHPELANAGIQNDHTGQLISLDDPKFSRDIGTLGLWQPLSFYEKYGAGIYLLDAYQPGLTPVIFIHGAGGNPGEFSALIDALDRERFQPWVLHYPSGFRLGIVSDYLLKSINKLQNRYDFRQFALVAHSMGGLVMRSTVKKYRENAQQAEIILAMTINSPMMGMHSASRGVKMSPIVLPYWYDVAEGSAFIDDIMNWAWPNDIPYHLVFSYQHGDSSDGTVPLESQIPLSLQSEALRLYGFNAGHATVLQHTGFTTTFREIMEARHPRSGMHYPVCTSR